MTRSESLSLACALLLSLFVTGGATSAADGGFRPIFDGKTLTGWSSPDLRYWSVEDGAITGRSSADVPCTKNQFLVWDQGELDDFELKLRFRILGGKSANSGIQIRSTIAPDGHAAGYQCDMDRGAKWLGALYDEHTGRGMLAARGQRTVIAADGKRESSKLDVGALKVDPEAWNDYHIVARGSRITLRVNGVVTADVEDHETAHRDLQGRLAVQIHSGPAMTVQFKDVQLKRLPLAERRKKVVFLAGRPSHPSGQHEFGAGAKLLLRRLAAVDSVLASGYFNMGWPKDPTAFDNADAVIVYSDGQGAHPIVGHFDEVDALMKRGTGLMCMHYAVHVDPKEQGNAFRRWIGGAYETDYSSNPHWDAELKPNKRHPITRGVNDGTIHDEWYFCMRFRPDMRGVEPILEAKPSDKTRSMNNWPRKRYPHIVAMSGRSEILMWATERADGGRGVGFTGGHWHRNWAYELQRRVILNAILWVAGAEVPAGGVDSEPVSEEELNQNLDKKRKMVQVELPEGLRQK